MRRARLSFGRRSKTFPSVGQLFDERYQLVAQLGSGGGSVVFRALDTRLNREVALKVLGAGEMDSEAIARFRREAISVARLTHPGIVTIYDFDESDGLPYIVLELVPGVDLWKMMYEQRVEFKPEASIKICVNILDALAYAHAQGVVHRDLKPENVMVMDDELHTKVTDFGLAYIRGQSRITRDGVIAGSAYYMAPEVAGGKASDHRVDLYALGVMLYELLTGRLPFYSENPIAVISHHLYDAPLPPSRIKPDISPALEAIILKLLAKRPEDRFSSAEAVRDALLNLDSEQLQPERYSEQFLIERINRLRPTALDDEWIKLRDCWTRIQIGAADAPPVVMVVGEAGTGKAQLAYQLINEVRLAGGCALHGQCYQSATPLPYQPIIEILRDCLRNNPQLEISPMLAADLAKLVPEVADDHPIEALPPLPPEAERQRLSEHLTQFLIELAQRQSVLIFIEYLHCTDESSLNFINYLARRIRGKPIMLLGTYRPSELNYRHPLEALMRELIGQDLVERIMLRHLTMGDVAAMIKAVFESELDPMLTRAIYERTQGNLFFTKELIKALVTEGHIFWDEGKNNWQVKQIEQIELPSSIRSIIGQLISRLSDTAAEVLAAGAMIGSEFTFRLLQAVAEVDEDALYDALGEAVAVRLIGEKKDTREETYFFINTAIRQTVLETLNQRRKSRLHLKIARTLERLYPHQLDEQIENIARHYSLGARTDEEIDVAIHYLERAADRASRLFALANALEFYNTALELAQDYLSPEREERILALRERRGGVHQQVGDFVAAAADLEAVLQSPIVNHDRAHKRAVLLQLGQVYRRSEQFDLAIKTLTDAVEISRTMHDDRLVADALYFLGATYWSQGNIKQATEHQEEAYAIVTRLGLQDEVAMRVLHGLAECCGRLVDYPRLFQLAEQSLHLARQLGDVEYQSENLVIIGAAQIDRGDYARAQAIFEENLQHCLAAGLRWHATSNKAYLGLAKAGAGDYAAAFKLLNEALETATQHYKGFLLTMIWHFLGRCYLDLEALPQAAEALSTGLDQAQRHRVRWNDAATIAYWARAQIRLGNLEVGALLEETLQQAILSGDRVYGALVYRALAELEIARGNPEVGLRRAEEMRELAVMLDQPMQIVQADYWRAQALIKLGRYAEAQPLLEGAVEAAVKFKSPRLSWKLHQALGEVYEATQQPTKAAQSRKRVAAFVQDMMQHITDPMLRAHLEAQIPTAVTVQSLTTTLRLLVISDAFGSTIQNAIRQNLADVLRCDAVISLGDLPAKAYPALRGELGLGMTGLCVLGNHDSPEWAEWLPRYKFQHLHQNLASLRIGGREITFAGFSGSERYKPGNSDWQWEECEAAQILKTLPPCDILLTHTAPAPPPGYPQDNTHRGLSAIGGYIEAYQPRMALHGHFHQNYQRKQGETWIVGCFGAVLIQCMIADHSWQVEVQPLLKFGE